MQSQGETDLRRKMTRSLGMEMLGGVQPLPHAESDRDGDMELETQGAFWADNGGSRGQGGGIKGNRGQS